MAAISFSSVLKILSFGFSFANLINRHSHYKCTAHHTNRGWLACDSGSNWNHVFMYLMSSSKAQKLAESVGFQVMNIAFRVIYNDCLYVNVAYSQFSAVQ